MGDDWRRGREAGAGYARLALEPHRSMETPLTHFEPTSTTFGYERKASYQTAPPRIR